MPNTSYEGLPVRKHSVAVRGASGDALNGSLKVEPRDFHPGERAFMVLEVVPADVNHKPMNDGDAWDRVQIVKVARGCFVDGKIALPHLDAVTVALEDLRVEQTGQERLDLETKMEDDHRAGLHKRFREKCPLCQAAKNADPLGVGRNGVSDQAVAKRDELAARREAHGDGEGDAENPTRPATRRRSRPAGVKGAAKGRARKSTPKK
jgi:ribosome modulation factor